MSYDVEVSGEGFVIAWHDVGAAGVPMQRTKRQRNRMFLENVAAGLNKDSTHLAYRDSLDFLCRFEDAV
jgi:hypothetical protein